MRNFFLYPFVMVIVTILSSTQIEAEYSGSKGGFNKKSDFDSMYNGYLSEYAGHLSAGKALEDLTESSHLPSEHGSEFDDNESHNLSETFGEEKDNEDGSNFDKYNGGFESLKFSHDVDAQHYSGGESSETEDSNHHHLFQNHHDNFQFDEPEKSTDYKSFGFEETQIVPYSGREDSEENEEPPPKYSGYDSSEENEVHKLPAKSYESKPKVPAPSYSQSIEAAKASSVSFEEYKPSKAAPLSYSHFYEASKPSPILHSSFYDSSKTPTSPSYIHSFEEPKKSSSYESHTIQHEPVFEKYGGKKLHIIPLKEAPPKYEVVHKYKSSSLKDFHLPLQKNLMTINHGKGGYSFSSVYRS